LLSNGERELINQLLPWLYVGDCESAWDAMIQNGLAIKTIINLHDHDDPDLDGVEQFQFSLVDGEGNSWETIKEILDIMDERRRAGNILVHCCAGMSRSPFIILSYLVVKEGKEINQAMNLIDGRHPRRSINPHLIALINENQKRIA
jgi:protein-tyrosine phosphatase